MCKGRYYCFDAQSKQNIDINKSQSQLSVRLVGHMKTINSIIRRTTIYYTVGLIIVFNTFMHWGYCNLCPASSLNDIKINDLLPYPEVYFQIDDSKGSTSAIQESAWKALQTNMNNERVFNCTDYYESLSGRDREKTPNAKNVVVQRCITDDCPIKARFVQNAIKASSSWKSRQANLCDLIVANNKVEKEPKNVKIIVLGGSMTYGSGTEDSCCCVDFLDKRCPGVGTCKRYEKSESSNDFYCGWVGFFFRWIVAAFPHIKFELVNIASSGTDSALMGETFSDRLEKYNLGRSMNITSDDIILIDHSMNDSIMSLVKLKVHFELLIRRLISYSYKFVPKIVIIEQYTPNYNSYPTAYRELARHYEIPVWSYRETVISEKSVDPNNFFSKMKLYPTHPPWHVHMFIADIFANILTYTLSNCSKKNLNSGLYSERKSKLDTPLELYNLSSIHHSLCDKDKPYVLRAVPRPKSKLHSIANSNYNNGSNSNSSKGNGKGNEESPGWHEMIETSGHGQPAFIISAHPDLKEKDERRILRFPISPELRGNDVLKIIYLKTYENAGVADIEVCGKRVYVSQDASIDALFKDYKTNRISIPFIYASQFPFGQAVVDHCFKNLKPNERFLDVIYTSQKDNLAVRGNQKMKIFSIDICRAAPNR